MAFPRKPAHHRFPAPVERAGHVDDVRRTRLEEMRRAALLGVCVRLAAVLVEAAALWEWGYAALLTDVVASLFDVVASLILLLAIQYAARPPDSEHPFGHGRMEPLVGLQLGVLLALAGVWLAFRHVIGLARTPASGEVATWAWGVPFAAAVALEVAARLVGRTGRRQQSPALEAEAAHYRVDALTSVVAAAGLAAAAVWPEWGRRLDLLAAAVLAGIMVVLGARAAWENLHQLVDRIPDEESFDRVRTAALKVAGVEEVEKLRIRQAGPDAHVDIDIEVDPGLSVAEAHVITQHVRAQIQADWPMVRDVTVHVEPYYEGDH
jgi:cation diffusion facilitator family transporter